MKQAATIALYVTGILLAIMAGGYFGGKVIGILVVAAAGVVVWVIAVAKQIRSKQHCGWPRAIKLAIAQVVNLLRN